MSHANSNINVTFIDDSTGETLGVTELPQDDLPESFEIDTTLHLGEEDWNVVHADPKVRSEYVKSKSLTLRLRQVETIDPSKILYSLPTICDSIPGVSDQPLVGNEFVLAEDDWRQLELVSSDLHVDVDAEISKIRSIHEKTPEGAFWKEIHVRTKPELPLIDALNLDHLFGMFPGSDLVAIAYYGANTQIADGYAFRAKGLTVYGLAPGGVVTVIAFDKYPVLSDTALVEQTKTFARNANLELVDWCRCARLSPDDSRFDSIFEPTGA